jgi:hypothetical protein
MFCPVALPLADPCLRKSWQKNGRRHDRSVVSRWNVGVARVEAMGRGVRSMSNAPAEHQRI